MCLTQQQLIEFLHNTSDVGNLKNNEAKGRLKGKKGNMEGEDRNNSISSTGVPLCGRQQDKFQLNKPMPPS
jgi:hypothetical protein